MNLYLIRHGETDYNRNRIIQGHSEVPLNDAGIAQASRLAEKLASAGIDRIYSSDLRRAAMTSAILAARIGAPLIFDPAFRERNPGELVRRTYEEAARFFDDPDYLPPAGESVAQFEQRIRAAFEDLLQREPDRARTIAVVSHGMVCASFLKNCIGHFRAEHPAVRWPNTSVTIARYTGKWELVVLSDASHLDASDLEQANGAGG